MRSLTSGSRWAVRSALVMAATLSLIAMNPASGAATGMAAPAETPVQTHGKLHVCGTQLCDQSGKAVQLRGMSTHGTQWYAHCLTDRALDVLAYDWKVSVLRVATYALDGGYNSNPQKFTDLASQLIEKASARGMYVIVDWHHIGPGDPNANIENAKKFLKEIAQRHKHRNNVIYEIANEPNKVSWERIKSYSEAVIPVIREQDPDSVILVGTRGWSTLGEADGGNENEVVANPVRASNIMYTFHYYAQWYRDRYRNRLDIASSKLPMFVTEWGTSSWTGYTNDFPMAQKFVDLMAKKKISWTNWAVADNAHDLSVFKQGVCSAGTFAGTGVLKPAGVWVRERIRG
ncbi:glycoside hydrolase family 5 protein [Streptomyces sp. NPDC005408]|uniref:glycoside hydrolase family 5 protein n=1 Tax=Streptomyces sp. NPDC005408 TaxID=3155341 RepID=UPI0033B77E9B